MNTKKNDTETRKKAVVLLSGGLDSSTTLAFAVSEGYRCYALTFRYGQRHEREVQSAKDVSQQMNAENHLIIELNRLLFAGSALTGGEAVPVDRSIDSMPEQIPSTYVPGRNTVFLASAVAYAERIGAFDIFIGANAIDYSGYPDCRPEFIAAFENVANLGTKSAVTGEGKFRIHAPLISKTKVEIVKLAIELGVDMALTWSCYSPDAKGGPCMRCDSCLIRERAFSGAGITDPLIEG